MASSRADNPAPDWPALLAAAVDDEIRGSLWRIVESQSQVATTALVDNLEEQALLEQLIETSKPPMVDEYGAELPGHYLLTTPFRYPPLRWGSRFGRRHEPAIYYGSRKIDTALAESAYYRLLFWEGMAEPPGDHLVSQHEMFSAGFACKPGVRLMHPRFSVWQDILASKSSYSATQLLGTMMREHSIQGFEFRSARCQQHGANIGLFSPGALCSREPESRQPVLCETTGDAVRYRGANWLKTFGRVQFVVDGRLPAPA